MKAGWELEALGEVCEIAPKKALAKKTLTNEQLVSFVPMDHLGILESHFTAQEERSLSSVYKGYTYFCDDDVIIAKITPCFENGKMGVVSGMTNGVGFGSSEFVPIRGTGKTIPKYLFYYLLRNDFRENGARVMTGAVGHKRVPKEYLENLPIPLPPLAEQKRIVSILDGAFEGLDRARENAEANLKNARELFESVLQETLGSKYQVEREVTLGEVCILAQGLAINKTTKHLLVSKSSKPLLRIKDLRSGSVEQYVAEEGYPSGAEVSADDIIYTRTGQIGLVFRGFSGVLHNNCFSIRCINGLDQNYCFWWLQERNFRRQIVRLASRAAQPDITHKIFKAQEVTLPNEDNQKLAVVSIERAFDQMQKLQTTYQTKLQDISDLRQSLLQKAFAGELT